MSPDGRPVAGSHGVSDGDPVHLGGLRHLCGGVESGSRPRATPTRTCSGKAGRNPALSRSRGPRRHVVASRSARQVRAAPQHRRGMRDGARGPGLPVVRASRLEPLRKAPMFTTTARGALLRRAGTLLVAAALVGAPATAALADPTASPSTSTSVDAVPTAPPSASPSPGTTPSVGATPGTDPSATPTPSPTDPAPSTSASEPAPSPSDTTSPSVRDTASPSVRRRRSAVGLHDDRPGRRRRGGRRR